MSIDDVVDAMLDQAEIDWPRIEAAGRGTPDAPALEQLKILGLINQLHTQSTTYSSERGGASVLWPVHKWGALELRDCIATNLDRRVYHAWDPELDRPVALKLLSVTEADRNSRVSEGRLLARVRHPHVVTVYGADTIDSCAGLWMEFIDGETLHDLVRQRGPLSPYEAALIGRDVCGALAAVHRMGLLHGDVTAKNVMRERAGRIVLMDFGLGSEMVSRQGENRLVLGTPFYIAPEVLKSEPATAAADIYGVGVLLWYLVSGGYPHQATSFEELLAHVMEPVALRNVRPDLPEEFARVVERAIAAEVMQRYSTAGALEQALSRVLSPEHAATPVGFAAPARDEPTVLPVRHVRRLWWTAAGSLGAAVLLALGYLVARGQRMEAVWQNPLAEARFTRLTDFEGSEHDAAISPDGRFVAFRADRDGPFDVWLSQVGTGRFVNLTHGQDDEMRLGLRSVGFSADGSEIWLSGGPDRRVRLLPLLGGTPRVFLGEDAVNIAWSPDGTRLAYHTRMNGDPLYIADRSGANPHLLFVHPKGAGGHTHYPTWSLDGRWIYFVTGTAAISQMDLWRVPSIGGTPERLTYHNTDVAYPTPIDDRTVLYVAPDQDGSGPWIWVLDLEHRTTHRATVGLERYTSLAATTDGQRLVATVANPTTGLWTIPILDRPADERDATPYPLPTVNPMMPRFGGGSLFHLSLGGVGSGLWRYQNGQAMEIWKGAEGTLLAPPSISPDGRRVAIAVRRGGHLRLHVLSSDGAELQALTDTIDVHGATCWSPDGRWIVTGGDAADGPGLFKVPLTGGAPTRLVNGDAYHPIWSPDGTFIAYVGETVAPYSPLLAVSPDGAPVRLPPIQLRYGSDRTTPFGGERARFLPSGKGLVYMQGLLPQQDFWLLDLTTNNTRQLTHLRSGAAMRTFDMTPDGKHIVFDRSRENSDIVLIELAGASRKR
jgi:Tol biopolymer transport system component